MLSFDEAQLRILSGVQHLGAENVSLAEAAGRVLARDVLARGPLPRFDHSAMDGYALDATALEGEPPWTIRVEGVSRAGAPPAPAMAMALVRGAACRIFTGARMPENSNAVVMQENVHREGDTIRIASPPTRGQNVRRKGEDLAEGAVALEAGRRLSAGAVALAAMLDCSELATARRPRVTILCTGNELRAPGRAVVDARDASIPESNSAALAVLARQAGAVVRVASIVGDDLDDVSRAISQALESADVLLTVGGVSVGDHDVVRPALERAGVDLDFWQVAIKPGRPLVVGRTPRAYVLGLPGNPASAIVTFALFGAPLVRALQGDLRPHAIRLPVGLSTSRRRSRDRLELLRATLGVEGGALRAKVHDNQASGSTTALAHSDGLAMVPAGDGPLEADVAVDFVRWNDV